MMEDCINNCHLLCLPKYLRYCPFNPPPPNPLLSRLHASNYHVLLLIFAIRGASEINVFLHWKLSTIGHEWSACAETKMQTNTHNGVMFFSAANTNCCALYQQYSTSLQRKTFKIQSSYKTN
jgi:hypothetical protein